jgi:transposase
MKAVSNLSNRVIGKLMGFHPNQVGQYLRIYQRQGLSALCMTGYGTNESDLEAHAEVLIKCFTEAPPLSLAQARQQIIDLVGIDRSISRVRAFLRRHGFRYRKSGYVPGKANAEQQREWLREKLEPEIQAAEAGEKVLLFMDAAHFVLSHFCCMMWCVKRLFIRSGAGRNRINVLGAVNAIPQELTTLINDTYINAEVIMAFLLQLRQKYPHIPITLVLDNARYQHCSAVIAFASSLDITLLFLPPYSPNLNIIERLWKFVKKKVLYGRYFDSPKRFHQAIRDFFDQIQKQAFQQEMKTLLTLKFHFIEHSRIYAK